jgi:transcriptional antiterminator RfaH
MSYVEQSVGIYDGLGSPVVGGNPDNPSAALAWYCARTKPKNEHIAAANLRRNLGLRVFHPRLRVRQTTIRGVIKQLTEPVFPGYIFVHCALDQHLDQLRHTSGISSLVHFGGRIPHVPLAIVADLQNCFGVEEILDLHDDPRPGDPVTVAAGPFMGMSALVLRSWPAKRRVQVLLEVLGRPTPIEIDRDWVTLHHDSIAEFVPILAAG